MMASKTKRRPASAIADLRERIRTEGAEAAFEALMHVCRDPKASAQAKATAGSTLFRSAGLMEKVDDDLDDKPLEEMTFDELQEVVLRAARERGAPDDLIDAVAQIDGELKLAHPSEAAPARQPRRTTAPAGSSLDEFG